MQLHAQKMANVALFPIHGERISHSLLVTSHMS